MVLRCPILLALDTNINSVCDIICANIQVYGNLQYTEATKNKGLLFASIFLASKLCSTDCVYCNLAVVLACSVLNAGLYSRPVSCFTSHFSVCHWDTVHGYLLLCDFQLYPINLCLLQNEEMSLLLCSHLLSSHDSCPHVHHQLHLFLFQNKHRWG